MAQALTEWPPSAISMLDDVYEYIDSQPNGLRLKEQFNSDLIDILSHIEDNPKIGFKFKMSFRYVLFNKYRLVYYYEESEGIAWITSIFHVKSQQYNKQRNLHLPDKN